jgi:leucyl/phenylalanyl-tRNA--protein transferase
MVGRRDVSAPSTVKLYDAIRSYDGLVPVYSLGRALAFPPPDDAEEGLLAVGGDLSAERLLLAYRSGIFPWYDEDLPILWHSPDPRCVLVVDRLHVGRSLRRVLAKHRYAVRFDNAFERVIRACKTTPRGGQDGTWITDDMERSYVQLHRMGYAHSVEAWDGHELAGGLYGVSLGRMFFGESMFSWQSNASKVALVNLAERLAKWDFRVIDAQVATPNTLAMGAEQWPRAQFLEYLSEALDFPTRKGSWANADPELEAPLRAIIPSRGSRRESG